MPGSTPHTINLSTLLRAGWYAAALVIGLGVARELVLPLLSPEMAERLKHLRHFALDGEHNVSAWFTSALMLAGALASIFLSTLDRPSGGAREGSGLSAYWLGLGLLFVAMSVDESASFHEAFITILAGLGQYSDFLHFAWVVPGAIFVIAFVALYARFLLRVPPKVALGLIAAGAVFVTGALVLEIIDGWVMMNYGEESALYIAGYCLEDSLEIIGVMMFVQVVAAHAVGLAEGRDTRLVLAA